MLYFILQTPYSDGSLGYESMHQVSGFFKVFLFFYKVKLSSKLIVIYFSCNIIEENTYLYIWIVNSIVYKMFP